MKMGGHGRYRDEYDNSFLFCSLSADLPSHDHALARFIGGRICALLDLAEEEIEYFGDVGVGSCTCLDESSVYRLGEPLSFRLVDLPSSSVMFFTLLSKITLLPYDDTRDFRFAGEVENLIVHDGDHIERLPVCDVINQNVAVNADGMFRRMR